ncbi:hypothetical protein ABT158_45735, partial [Nonomuraea sp. NPDC001636]|uniref:hypothetical protein n=1 Tax=Nonomuraea sp. NPDC001636 TaxID=3154391 RepID=UPI0033242F92
MDWDDEKAHDLSPLLSGPGIYRLRYHVQGMADAFRCPFSQSALQDRLAADPQMLGLLAGFTERFSSSRRLRDSVILQDGDGLAQVAGLGRA